MTLILSGTDGLSDIDGSAATPAIRGTDANTGIFFPAADTIAFSEGGAEAMRINSSGNVGIGTSSPVNKLEVASGGLYVSGNGTYSATGYGFNTYNLDNTKTILLAYNRTTSAFMDVVLSAKNSIFENNGTERARIDSSGNLLVGTTSALPVPSKIVVVYPGDTTWGIGFKSTYLTGSGQPCTFVNSSNTQIGYISTNGTGTTYATTSDYRLKEDISPMTGALAKVQALKPVNYKWKSDGSVSQGFIAHELQEVVPDCVTGEKDAVETYTDEDGNEQTRPKYQGVDTSFLVATLTAAIQEQQALITQLQADVAALKGTP